MLAPLIVPRRVSRSSRFGFRIPKPERPTVMTSRMPKENRLRKNAATNGCVPCSVASRTKTLLRAKQAQAASMNRAAATGRISRLPTVMTGFMAVSIRRNRYHANSLRVLHSSTALFAGPGRRRR